MSHPHQLIVCDGPRCSRAPAFVGLLQRAGELREKHPECLELSSYPCLGRCGVGPNVLLRKLQQLGAGEPGFRDLDGTTYYFFLVAAKLEAIVESHCLSDAPLPDGQPF